MPGKIPNRIIEKSERQLFKNMSEKNKGINSELLYQIERGKIDQAKRSLHSAAEYKILEYKNLNPELRFRLINREVEILKKEHTKIAKAMLSEEKEASKISPDGKWNFSEDLLNQAHAVKEKMGVMINVVDKLTDDQALDRTQMQKNMKTLTTGWTTLNAHIIDKDPRHLVEKMDYKTAGIDLIGGFGPKGTFPGLRRSVRDNVADAEAISEEPLKHFPDEKGRIYTYSLGKDSRGIIHTLSETDKHPQDHLKVMKKRLNLSNGKEAMEIIGETIRNPTWTEKESKNGKNTVIFNRAVYTKDKNGDPKPVIMKVITNPDEGKIITAYTKESGKDALREIRKNSKW